jgi:hypothetical protein
LVFATLRGRHAGQWVEVKEANEMREVSEQDAKIVASAGELTRLIGELRVGSLAEDRHLPAALAQPALGNAVGVPGRAARPCTPVAQRRCR